MRITATGIREGVAKLDSFVRLAPAAIMEGMTEVASKMLQDLQAKTNKDYVLIVSPEGKRVEIKPDMTLEEVRRWKTKHKEVTSVRKPCPKYKYKRIREAVGFFNRAQAIETINKYSDSLRAEIAKRILEVL